uniref:Nyctalopin n=1 Tax=Cyprinodon variegatus TaxID=28743 RepID=A0A3Q2FEZ3_CYPVA
MQSILLAFANLFVLFHLEDLSFPPAAAQQSEQQPGFLFVSAAHPVWIQKYLNLQGNRINVIHDNAFQDLVRLENFYLNDNLYLNLQGNRINVIHDNAFQDLVRLENFYLNDNLLSVLPRLPFKGLSRLKMLNLGGNQLTNVSRTWFSDLMELEVLYLDRNQLLNIEEGSFENLTSLITLHLNSNNLTTLPFSVFQPIYFLAHLYLFRNPWECDCSLDWLKQWMENYNQVVFPAVNGSCVDPSELNLTTASSELMSTTENRFNSLISKLLQQELREEMGNGTESLRNGTLLDSEEGQLSAGAGGPRTHTFHSLLGFMAAWIFFGSFLLLQRPTTNYFDAGLFHQFIILIFLLNHG